MIALAWASGSACSHRRRDAGRDTPVYLLDLRRPSDRRRAPPGFAPGAMRSFSGDYPLAFMTSGLACVCLPASEGVGPRVRIRLAPAGSQQRTWTFAAAEARRLARPPSVRPAGQSSVIGFSLAVRQPRHDVERRLPDLRALQGSTQGAQRDHGEGPQRYRCDRQRSGARRDQHAYGVRPRGLRSRQDDLAGGHGAAFDLARLRCCRESHRSALSRYPLGYRESDFPHRHFFALQPLIIGAKGWSAALPR